MIMFPLTIPAAIHSIHVIKLTQIIPFCPKGEFPHLPPDEDAWKLPFCPPFPSLMFPFSLSLSLTTDLT